MLANLGITVDKKTAAKNFRDLGVENIFTSDATTAREWKARYTWLSKHLVKERVDPTDRAYNITDVTTVIGFDLEKLIKRIEELENQYTLRNNGYPSYDLRHPFDWDTEIKISRDTLPSEYTYNEVDIAGETFHFLEGFKFAYYPSKQEASRLFQGKETLIAIGMENEIPTESSVET